jgi:ribosome biogenesis GTPase
MPTRTEHPGEDVALVVATFSRRMRIRLASGAQADARIKGKRLRPVCGDRVRIEAIPNEHEWLITDILKRDNELSRPNLRGKVEVLAANIDRLVVMAAPSPKPDWAIVDRYLCAAEIMGIDAAIIYNKADLPEPESVDAALEDYRRIGYTTIRSSAKHDEDVATTRELLQSGISIIVGQSGVGKSSLINRLLGGEQQRTAGISDKTGEGRHTTVNSVMLDIPGGGAVVDSPGVRDYAPALTPDVVGAGYRELARASEHCRFSNCQHLREPGCAVKESVDEGAISKRRYDSYRHLLALTRKLDARRY